MNGGVGEQGGGGDFLTERRRVGSVFHAEYVMNSVPARVFGDSERL